MRCTIGVVTALVVAAGLASGQTVLNANPPPSNNGGSAGWAMFLDLQSLAGNLAVTELRTASSAAANATFNIEIFTREGTALGAQGPGGSPAGWTSLGVVTGTQGPGGPTNDVSLPIDIPDINVPAGQVVGVALLFSVAGPRYYGTGSPPYQTFMDSNLKLVTGDARSAPFTPGGSFFSSRGLVGSVTYIPEPAALALLGFALAAARRR